MGKEMFIIQHLEKCEFALGHDLNAIHAYKKMHARYRR